MWTSANRIIAYGVMASSLRMLVGAISTVYLINNGLSLFDIGLLKGLQALIILFLDIPLAYFADKHSRKLSVSLSVLFASIWLLVTGIATARYHFYIAECFNAISIALLNGAFISYLVDSVKKSKTSSDIHKIVAEYQAYQFMSMGISAFIGSALIKTDSSLIWIVAATLCIILFFGFSWVLPRDNIKNKSQFIPIKESIKTDFFTVVATFKDKDKNLFGMSLTMLNISLFYQVLIQYWQPLSFSYLDVYPKEGIIFGSIFALILVSQSIASWLSSKIKNTEILLSIGLFLSFIGLLLSLLSFYKIFSLMIPAIIVMFMANRITSIAITGFFHSRINSSLRATFDSVISTLLRITLFIIIPLIGILINQFGWITFFMFYGLVILFAVIMSILQTRRPLSTLFRRIVINLKS